MTRTLQRIIATFALTAGVISSASAAPILIVENDKLMGAAKVDINGVLYDVAFADGSFHSLYPKGFSNFSGQATSSFALAAANALGAQVFTSGRFDATPGLTNGCGSTVQDCHIYTPYAPSSYPSQLVAYSFRNSSMAGDGVFGSWGYSPDTDFTGRTNTTYAVWSLHRADVPEPGTSMILALGLAALGLSRRRSLK